MFIMLANAVMGVCNLYLFTTVGRIGDYGSGNSLKSALLAVGVANIVCAIQALGSIYSK